MSNKENEVQYSYYISKIIRSFDTDIEKYALNFMKFKATERSEIIIDASVIVNDNELRNLANQGFVIHPRELSKTKHNLFSSLAKANIVYEYNRYGFKQIDGEYVFFGEDIISNNEVTDEYINANTTFNITPKGDKKEWLRLYEEEIVGNTSLEFAVLLGLSAPLVSLLNEHNPDLNTIIVHLAGESTTGKSTASMLALSTVGNPLNNSKTSLFKRWSSTNGAIMTMLEGANAIPIVLDELSTSYNYNLTELVYSVTEGVGRDKLNSTSKLTLSTPWNNVIISTGESSIFNRLNDNTGLKVRVFEFFGDTWTKSAEQAEKIKEVVSKNYGHILKDFVSTILQLGKNKIFEMFEEEKKVIQNKFPESRLISRIASKLAVFLTTARLLNESNVIKVEYDKILELIIRKETDLLENEEIAEVARHKLFQYLVAHQYLLKLGENINGRVIGKVKGSQVFILSEEFHRIMENNLEFEDSKLILKKWEEKSYFVRAEKDRLCSRINLVGNTRSKGYWLKIPDDYLSDLTSLSYYEENSIENEKEDDENAKDSKL